MHRQIYLKKIHNVIKFYHVYEKRHTYKAITLIKQKIL